MFIKKNNLNDLGKLNYHIHDKWFDVEKIAFDNIKREFRLFFGDTKESYDECLKITGVSKCSILDTEKVGVYDIYQISVDEQTSEICIEGCIPIKIVLNVSKDFEISVSKTNTND